MNYGLLFILSLYSARILADQVEILAKGRDHFITQAINNLRQYCKDAPFNSYPDSIYICRLQVEEDCSRNKEKEIKACEALKKVKDMEMKSTNYSKSISELSPTPPALYSTNPVIVDPDKKEETPAPIVPVPEVLQEIKVHRGSSADLAPKVPEALADSKTLESLKNKINAQKIRLDCHSDDECKIQEFGSRLCGGPVGTFVYSERGEVYKSLTVEIAEFNKADEAFSRNWNKDLLGTCDWNGRSEPAKCKANKCI